MNLKPVKLLFLTCSSADVYARTFLILHKKGVGGGEGEEGVFKRRGGLTFDNEG